MEDSRNDIIETLISRYLSGEATRHEEQELVQWLEADRENRRYFDRLKNIWQAAAPPFDPEEIGVEEAYNRVAGKLNFQKKKSSFVLWFSRAAAILLIPLLIATTYFGLKKPSAGEVVYQEIHAPYGTYSQVRLPDGTQVSVNAGSKLKFPTVFSESQRNVYLDGEAYFEVVSSPERPFIVHTQKFSVKATGTKFNVEDYNTDTIAAITLIEGIVDATPATGKPVTLKPGERMLLSKASGQLRLSKTDPYKWYAWKDGTLIFRDDPLEYVFKRLNQTFNVDITIRDAQLATHPYRATFTNESLEEIMRLLKLSAPIAFKELERNHPNGEYRTKRTIEVFLKR